MDDPGKDVEGAINNQFRKDIQKHNAILTNLGIRDRSWQQDLVIELNGAAACTVHFKMMLY